MLKIYSTPECFRCKAVTRRAIRKGVPYQIIDVSKSETERLRLKEKGFSTVPVCEANGQMWDGVNFEKIDALSTNITPK